MANLDLLSARAPRNAGDAATGGGADLGAPRTVVGLDLGAVALGLVELDRRGAIVHSDYALHRGDLRGTLTGMLARLDLGRVGWVAVTGAGAAMVAQARAFDSQVAVITACRRRHPQAAELLIVGGEKFSLVRFDDQGNYRYSRCNSGCAAGTGSFLDQQAGRLDLADSACLSQTAGTAGDEAPHIASRCAVFAKTDLIHAQAEGHSLAAICNGLCKGLAANIVDTLFASERLSGQPMVMAGGVALNQAVRDHISRQLGCSLVVDDDAHLYGALGAGLLLLAELEPASGARAVPATSLPPQTFRTPADLLNVGAEEHTSAFPPLTLRHSRYPDFASERRYLYPPTVVEGALPVEVDVYLAPRQRARAWLGIDIGSTSTKAVVMQTGPSAPAPGTGEELVLAGFYTRTAGQPLRAVQAIFEAIADWARHDDLALEIAGTGTTGSGRKLIGAIIGAELVLDEITAHARAAYQLDPQVDTVIEIGGQDAKFTTLRGGNVTLSIMNHVCAAGTGSFLEEQAARLGCRLEDLARRTADKRAPLVSDRCTVFMERDINHLLAMGYAVDEILAACLHAVRENYLLKVARESAIGQRVCFQGATAKNRSLVAAFEQKLDRPIQVSRFCHLTGALGVALALAEAPPARQTFRGIQLYRETIPMRGEVCHLCRNHCKLRVAEVRGQHVAYGFLCGREYDDARFVAAPRDTFDLLAERRKVFAASPKPRDVTIGLPAGLHLFEELPMWRRFFDLLGVRTVTSEGYKEAVSAGGHLAGAEFCAPMAAFHGHAAHLAERCDWLFVPTYLEDAKRPPGTRRQLCYYTQWAPTLLATINRPGLAERCLSVVLEPGAGPWPTATRLHPVLKPALGDGISLLQVQRAFTEARQEHERRRAELRRMGAELLAGRADLAVVLLGRPYTVLAPSMNKSIPELLAKQGVPCLYQDMLPPNADAEAAIKGLLDQVHWRYAAQILAATATVAATPGLYPVLVTSFKCAPDSCILEFVRRILDAAAKPYLILQVDEHDSQVGYETRIEAAVRAFRNHHAGHGATRPSAPLPIVPVLGGAPHGRVMLLPAWDPLACNLMAANLRHEGFDVRVLEEDQPLITRSLRNNHGQCIPLNTVAEEAIAYIERHDLDPAMCTLWTVRSRMACNIGLYPAMLKAILEAHDPAFARTEVYAGDLTGADLSLKGAPNMYLAFLFAGWLRRLACHVRPYERTPGETDAAVTASMAELVQAFERGQDKGPVIERLVARIGAIPTVPGERAKVAIFGDLYSRDNAVFNQGLVKTIERNGGEVVTTPYTEYVKIIADAYFRKWFREGKYREIAVNQPLLGGMKLLERRYLGEFERVLGPMPRATRPHAAEVLARYHAFDRQTGESMDNLLKVHSLLEEHPDLSLFVQANPAFCCPSLVTEAMARDIESQTGVPVVTITYDGTAASKNEVVVPYLQLAHRRRGAAPARRSRQG